MAQAKAPLEQRLEAEKDANVRLHLRILVDAVEEGIQDSTLQETEQVGQSVPMARQEIERYTSRSPGQAGSCFHGYTRLLELRAETELALGTKFDRQAFNTFLVHQGLLPPELLARAVREEFIPSVLAARAPGK